MTGSPSIASRISSKSSRCSGSSAASAASCSSSSSARIRCSTSSRRSPRNMCSVRHSPMPWAPNRRARAASSGVSALARTPSRRACVGVLHEPGDRGDQVVLVGVGRRRPRSSATTRESTTGTSPRKTSPVVPSIEITSPSLIVVAVAAREPARRLRRRRAPRRRRRRCGPCRGRPPRRARSCRRGEVRMPAAATMPCRSSGLVSRRTRITFSPRSAHSTAVSRVEDRLADGRAGRGVHALGDQLASASSSNCGNISCASWAPVTRSQRLVEVDQALVDQLGRRSGTRPRRCACRPGSAASRACRARR